MILLGVLIASVSFVSGSSGTDPLLSLEDPTEMLAERIAGTSIGNTESDEETLRARYEQLVEMRAAMDDALPVSLPRAKVEIALPAGTSAPVDRAADPPRLSRADALAAYPELAGLLSPGRGPDEIDGVKYVPAR